MTPAYLAATTIPLHHARIGWENLARGAVIGASSVAAGSYIQAPISDQTFEWWQPGTALSIEWWSATFAVPTVVNYCAIAVHEIGSAGTNIFIEYDDGGGWTQVPGATLTPANDGAIMILFEDISCDAIRLAGIGGTFLPRIGVIYFGRILEMQRPVKWMGHTPTRFNRDFEKRPNKSERGQRLGVSLIREGLSGKFNIENLSEAWVRSTFDLFIVNSMRYGYFMSWRPDQFPDEVYFGWTDKPIIPVNSRGGQTRVMSVNWESDFHSPENVAAWTS
jgi:hypothetical protein